MSESDLLVSESDLPVQVLALQVLVSDLRWVSDLPVQVSESTGAGVGSAGVGSAGAGSSDPESKSPESLKSEPSAVYAAVSSAASTDAGPDNTIPDINVRHKNLVRYLFFIYLNCSLLTVSMSLPPVYKGILSKLLFTLLCYFISELSRNINLFYSSIIIF